MVNLIGLNTLFPGRVCREVFGSNLVKFRLLLGFHCYRCWRLSCPLFGDFGEEGESYKVFLGIYFFPTKKSRNFYSLIEP
jgi:hypothetical protein